MFTKVNARQEQFLWLVVDGMPGSRAYATVYGQDKSASTCEVSASKLLRQPKVVARRQEIIAAKQARQPMTTEFLTREVIATIGEARALKQHSAALAGYQLVAKLHGLIVDRVLSDTIIRKPSESPESPDEMSAQDWIDQFGVKVIDHNSVPNTTTSNTTMLTATDTTEVVSVQSRAITDVVEDSIDE